MKRLLTGPLVHFLLLGAALFLAFSFVSDDGAPRDDEIVVSAGKIEHLAALFARTWQRPPTREELDGLIDDFIREEAAYREGMAIGLDRDDTVIRRRIRQKLDFIAEDIAARIEPTEEELAACFRQRADEFRIDPRLSFRHVYFNPDGRGDDLGDEMRDLLIALNGDSTIDAVELGDRILLDHGYADVSIRAIASLFGEAFAEAIIQLEPGEWHGPIQSGYGVHLLIVDARREGRLPELDEVREAVRREWEHARRQEVIEQYYAGLLAKYEIVIEWPESRAPDDPP